MHNLGILFEHSDVVEAAYYVAAVDIAIVGIPVTEFDRVCIRSLGHDAPAKILNGF